MMALMGRVAAYVRMHGGLYTLRRAVEMLQEHMLHTYHRRYLQERASDAELAAQRENQPDAGLISVAIPVYNTRPAFLKALTDSLLAQTYKCWEAVFYDGGSTSAESLAAMDAMPADPRIRVIHGTVNAGIAGNTNLAVEACSGGYIALCDHDDVLAPEALWYTAQTILQKHPDMLYSDEDKLTEDGRVHTDPHQKPDFCPDNLRSGNYICHLMVVKKSLLKELGGLRPAFDGSQDHDLALRISEKTKKICHVPRVLYHWRTVGSSVSHQHLARCQDAAARAVTEHMSRIGCPGCCTVEDGVLRLRYAVNEKLTVHTIRVSGRERYQQMNRAAEAAAADVLLFADESVMDISDDLIGEMMMYAQRDDVGAVTPMLTDRSGRVSHAGFAVGGSSCAVCRNRGLPWHAGGWHGLNRTSHNVAAVSAACFMIRRDHFIPFDEQYTDGLGAVDWCLRLSQSGLHHVYTPHARAVCTCSDLLSKWSEQQRFLSRWADTIDPCVGKSAPNNP
ncbi:MAG: glycosyltransferase [Clostridia bacterium]|nr:glycosyltransferase [Clostridia bacterium]